MTARKSPRIQIVLTRESLATLKRLAKSRKQSRSEVIRAALSDMERAAELEAPIATLGNAP